MTKKGRHLPCTLADEDTTISYTYNADGIRTSKIVNGVTTEYIIVEGVLAGIKGSNYNVFFHYDESGRATGLTGYASGVTVNYYYEYNAQGDVVAMYDHAGNLTCTYEYDSWGKLLSVKDANGAEITNATSVAYLNPIRYRGYVYDDETGLYYVGSRYYDPEVGRWINADAFVSTGQGILGYNMFVYCGNNIVNNYDPTGTRHAVNKMGLAGMGGGSIEIGILSSFITVFSAILSINIQEKVESLPISITIPTPSSFVNIENKLTDIALRQGDGHCDVAAKEMAHYLKKQGEEYKVLKLVCPTWDKLKNVWCISKNQLVGTNGYHMGVLYQGKVYCTEHVFGVSEVFWINDFVCESGRMRVEYLMW